MLVKQIHSINGFSFLLGLPIPNVVNHGLQPYLEKDFISNAYKQIGDLSLIRESAYQKSVERKDGTKGLGKKMGEDRSGGRK